MTVKTLSQLWEEAPEACEKIAAVLDKYAVKLTTPRPILKGILEGIQKEIK